MGQPKYVNNYKLTMVKDKGYFGEIYFTSDTHFGHEFVVRNEFPHLTIKEYNDMLVENWNSKVTKKDIVFILGDMFYKCPEEDIGDILGRLKGDKVLIFGNHDSWFFNYPKFQRHFRYAQSDMLLGIDDGNDNFKTMHLYHYPILEWDGYMKGAPYYMIHGHTHNLARGVVFKYMKETDRLLNAYVGINNWYPVTFEELVKNNEIFKDQERGDYEPRVFPKNTIISTEDTYDSEDENMMKIISSKDSKNDSTEKPCGCGNYGSCVTCGVNLTDITNLENLTKEVNKLEAKESDELNWTNKG